MARIGVGEILLLLLVWMVPLAVLGWLLSLASRTVRALESIADSLRQPRQ